MELCRVLRTCSHRRGGDYQTFQAGKLYDFDIILHDAVAVGKTEVEVVQVEERIPFEELEQPSSKEPEKKIRTSRKKKSKFFS